MSDEIQKCLKCKRQSFNYEKLESGYYMCHECMTKEWLDYMTQGGPWTWEAFIALKYLDELDEEIYNLSQHNQALEVEAHELREELYGGKD